MSSPRPDSAGASGDSSLFGNAQTLFQLAPRQLSDEFSLAKEELKGKAGTLGFGAGLFGAALVVLGLLVIALVVAAIMGLATVMWPWLAALLVAFFFLVLIAIAVLWGLRKIKQAMPLLPAEAIRGIKYDVGILREGAAFDPQSLVKPELSKEEKQKRKAEKAAKAKTEQEVKAADADPVPSEAELLERIKARREHLLRTRTGLLERMDVKAEAKRLLNDPESPVGKVKERWVPWSVAVVSATTFFVLLRKLIKR